MIYFLDVVWKEFIQHGVIVLAASAVVPAVLGEVVAVVVAVVVVWRCSRFPWSLVPDTVSTIVLYSTL
jgi:hypothetical protein